MSHAKVTDATAKLLISSEDDSSSPGSSQRFSNPSNLLTRTTIREANNHLQMLYTRNQELEQMIHQQQEELQRKDLEYTNLSKASQLLERHCQQVQALLDDRTRRLYVYERKEALFRETLELKPAIESLLDVLNTFEEVDHAATVPSASSIPINTKPLQFVQSAGKKKSTTTTDAVWIEAWNSRSFRQILVYFPLCLSMICAIINDQILFSIIRLDPTRRSVLFISFFPPSFIISFILTVYITEKEKRKWNEIANREVDNRKGGRTCVM